VTLLSIHRGDTETFTITLTDGAGDPLDLTGLAITFTAKRRVSDADEDAVIQKTDVDGIVVDADPTSGIAVLTIEPADTADLEDLRTLHWDVQVDDGVGGVRTPLLGRLAITADVTRTSQAGS
jgi:hypothetical protein